ncbi:MAG: hypothetical protein K6G18_09790 [Treponema sp.]|nr:hypothetical protein [Treponema sp.]
MESYVQKESGYADAKKNRRVARTALAIFAFGVGDLLLSTLFQDVLYAPLFMDTSFMMAALFAFGPIESFLEYVVFVSLACVKLKLMVGRTDMVFLYALSAITIIAVTWFFVRKKEWLSKGVNQTFLYILAAAMLAGCACSVVSGFISYFTHQLEVKDWAFNRVIFAFNGEQLGFLASAILGRIPVTILDRIIATFLGFGIAKAYGTLFRGKR